MPRKNRVWYPGAVYHIMCRGNHRQDIFRDDEDRLFYLTTLKKVQKDLPYTLHSYCLMTNHVHLQIETGDINISQVMKRINMLYAIYFNKKYNFVGYLFQDRYRSELIEETPHHLFNSLNRVDDLSEGLTNDLGEMGKYVFVSSWTETPEESIPFWKMYTKDMGGVRIGLRSYPFQTYRLPKISGNNLDIDVDKDIYFKPELFFNDQYIALPKWDILEKVVYTNNQDKLFPKLIETDGANTQMNLGIIGKYKRNEWNFQREWRYLIIFLPVSLNELCQLGNNLAQVVYDRLVAKNSLPFEDLYLDIAVNALNDMEITLGPCVNEGDKIIVESLVAKYCPTAIIRNSVLENSIRI